VHEPELKVHVLPPVNDPVESEVENVTVPVGEAPVTVAVQVVEEPIGKGGHDVVVVVDASCTGVGVADANCMPMPKTRKTATIGRKNLLFIFSLCFKYEFLNQQEMGATICLGKK
jgi:hypothetical protein